MAAATVANEPFHLEVMVHYDALAYCSVALGGECVHDGGVVRPSPISEPATLDGRRGQLEHRVSGILLSGTRKSNWLCRLVGIPT